MLNPVTKNQKKVQYVMVYRSQSYMLPEERHHQICTTHKEPQRLFSARTPISISQVLIDQRQGHVVREVYIYELPYPIAAGELVNRF